MQMQKRKFLIADPSKHKEYAPVSFMKRGPSTTRSVLQYLKMKRGIPVTALQVRHMFPTFFKGPVEAKRILKTLERRGFAQQVYDGAWRITESGISAVYLLAQRDKPRHIDAEDD